MTFVKHYEQVISWIMWHASFPPDKLVHTWVGLGFWLLGVLVVRRQRSLLPLALVVALECGNETVDYLYGQNWSLGDTLGDMLATWFWPVVLTLLLRSRLLRR